MYLIHCEHSRLCWVRTLSSLSTGHLSCLIICPSHRCCRCCHCHCPQDICPVEASSLSLSVRGLVICPPHCHCRPRAVCPAEVSLSSLSSGPHHLSHTLLSLSVGHLPCKGLIAVVVQWGVMLSVPHCCHHCCCRPPPTSSSLLSLSGGSYVVCPPPLSSLSSSATPHIIVIIVIRRPFVLWRFCHHHHPVGALLSVPHIVVIRDHLLPPTSSSLSGGGLIIPPPHCCWCCCCCPWAICPVEASSPSFSIWGYIVRPPPLSLSSLSGGGLVISPPHCHHHCPWVICSAEALLPSSFGGAASHPCLIFVVIVIWQGPRCHPHHHCCCLAKASSSTVDHACRVVIIIVQWGPHCRCREWLTTVAWCACVVWWATTCEMSDWLTFFKRLTMQVCQGMMCLGLNGHCGKHAI